MSEVERFQERLLTGDPEAAQQLMDAFIAFDAPFSTAIREAAAAIAESGLGEVLREILHAD
jgi:ABC-type sulfate transport system substrate-binding protein